MKSTKPSNYPEINQVLTILLSGVKKILQDRFTGMYLYGSLATGDFDPETSDIDFLVVTSETLDNDIVSNLEKMHHQLWDTGMNWADKLEGAYVSKPLIRRHDPNRHPCPTVNEGEYYLAPLGSDWIIQRHVIREFGVVLDGPDPKNIIDFVSSDEIRHAVLDTLHEWWFPMLENPPRLGGRGSEYLGYAVITMCRTLHALEYGTIVSKPIAIDWFRKNIDGEWSVLVNQAVRATNKEDVGISLTDTLKFIEFIRDRSGS